MVKGDDGNSWWKKQEIMMVTFDDGNSWSW